MVEVVVAERSWHPANPTPLSFAERPALSGRQPRYCGTNSQLGSGLYSVMSEAI